MGKSYKRERREAILANWPAHKQLEALAELQNGRPGKWLDLQGHIAAVRAANPAPGDDPVTLARAAKASEIVAACDAFLAPLAVEYCPIERQTWDQQSAEARALQADPESPAPLVRAMAAARGMDVPVLAGRILANEAAWKQIAGHVIGQRQALHDRLDVAQDVAAIQAITVEYSLPGA